MAINIKSSSRFQRRRRGAGAAFTDINVTPLVDVMLVLLIVFMVTAPMLTVGVPVDLPKTHAAKLNDQVEPIVISVDAAGKSYLQEMELEGEALIARLRAITESNPEARIYVRGDKSLAYGRVMEIMGEVAAAGFSKVSLIAEMPMGGPKPSVSSPLTASPTPPIKPAAPVVKPTGGSAVPSVVPSNAPKSLKPVVKSPAPLKTGTAAKGGTPSRPTPGVETPSKPVVKKGQ